MDGCTNSPLCPLSDPVTYVCSGETSNNDILRWLVLNGSNPSPGTSYTEGTDAPMIRTIGTYFNATLTSSAGPMRSNLSFTPVPDINNYNVSCDIVGTTPVVCSIVIAGIIVHDTSVIVLFTLRYSSCS